MQLQLAHFCQFLLDSYLRIKEEYWVEGRGLGEEMGRLKKKGLRMLLEVLGKRERERQIMMERNVRGLTNEGLTVDELEGVVGKDRRIEELEDEISKELQERLDQLQMQIEALEMYA
jgi:hypothetical protein